MNFIEQIRADNPAISEEEFADVINGVYSILFGAVNSNKVPAENLAFVQSAMSDIEEWRTAKLAQHPNIMVDSF